MEELRERRNKREGRHRDTWDPFQLNPIGAEKETKKRCMRFVQYMVAVMVGILVLVAGVLSKGALLIMCTVSGPTAMAEQREKQYYTLLLTVSLVVPNFLVFLKSLWKCAFKSSFHTPNMKMMGSICLIESLVALGTGILVLIVMPQFDILTNLFISGGVSLVSSLLQIGFRLQFRTQENWKIIFPICSVLLVLTGYSLLGADYWVRETTHNYIDYGLNQSYWYVLLAIVASTLVSLNWWENPFQASNKLQQELADLDKYRDFVFVFSSLLRIFIVGAVWVLYYSFIAPEKIVWDNFTNLTPEMLNQGLSVFFLQTICSMLCHWFGLVACKIHAVRMSFAVPVALTGPATLLLGLFLFVIRAHLLETPETERADIVNPFFGFCAHLKGLESEPRNATVVLIEVCRSVCRTSLNNRYAVWPVSMLALEGVCMWVGLLCAARFVWKTKVQRIERTSQLFVRRLYEAAFIDQSLLLNVRMKVVRAQNEENKDKLEDCMIYFCATMWHETYDEMLKILTSMFRFDRYRGDPKEEHSDSFDFECHILVDDAYMKEKLTDRRVVNDYVNDLIHVVIEVYRVFTNKEPDEVSIIETPYGGRLVFVMPEGNMLYVHLKDKALIRNKKRWSQIMYMYYLLGWKGYQSKNPPKIPPQNLDCRRGSLISLDGESYLLQNDTKRRHIADDHTYILALDGDTDFRPEAVILLVDRLRMYDNVGAACGRIHPTGMGPMVWYQKFEYAVGHWLQKTAEHVFGSVLCSPGCFSLFRGSAIMDDNILKRYTTKATRGSEYVQYDQGEDRWLCTLLLQQGWRVEYNAASDAYTNSPQEFAEFYNQRRRWGPSTLANTLDLLGSGKETVKKNTSISGLYIFYQIFTVGSSILGPASVTLMVAGAFQFVFKLAGTISIIISSIPPVIYIIICFTTKSNFQITIAAIMSVLYAFLMTASFFSIIGDMVTQGTFITPTGIFLISMAIMYLVTAILHPQEFSNIIYGLMYFICIPSGYLLLTIYSLVNMNNVSWGTRESSNREEGAARLGVLCDRTCKLCCWDMTCQVTQETESLLLQQVQQAVGPRGQPTPPGAAGAAGGAAGGGGAAAAAAAAAAVPVEQGAENGQQHDQPDARPEKKEEAQKTQRNLRMRKGARKDSSSDSGSEKSHSTDSDATAHAIYENDDDDDDDDDNMIADDMDSIAALPESEWVSPVKAEFMKKLTYFNLKRNLQAQIRYTLRAKNQDDVCEDLVMNLTDVVNSELNEVVGPEDVLEESQLEELQYALNEAARRILKTNRMERLDRRVKRAIERTLMAPQVEPLAEDETDFWHKLLERYLKPINDPQEHKENVERELKALRNRAVFLYFMLNLLWVVATFFLQAIGTETLSIKIPKFDPVSGNVTGDMNIEPVSLMFLLSFAVLLIVQFLAMLYHRVYTLIHVVSYRSTEKDYVKTEDGDEVSNDFCPCTPAQITRKCKILRHSYIQYTQYIRVF
ncbi:chitin synthase 1 [Engraulis encrasicolus]|uniref:chitin synthase 1 n=1 Tax=Engraulis encrasicolus TaxID=184585 RepID=UPI002FD08DFB